MTIIVRSMYNFVNCLQFNIRYEKVQRPAPMGGALVFWNGLGIWCLTPLSTILQLYRGWSVLLIKKPG